MIEVVIGVVVVIILITVLMGNTKTKSKDQMEADFLADRKKIGRNNIEASGKRISKTC